MEEKKVVVNGKKFTVKELKYKDVASLGKIPEEQAAKKMMLLSTGMSEKEYNELTMKEGLKIQKTVNELNGFGENFQQPPTKQ